MIPSKQKRSVMALTASAMLAALSVVLAYLAKALFGTMPWRVTIENMPIMLGSLLFGPLYGVGIGVCADLLSCVAAGQAPVPLITVGSALIGALPGLLLRNRQRPTYLRLLSVVLLTHLAGSLLVKSYALHFYFAFPFEVLVWRLPIYLGISVLEAYLIKVLFTNKELNRILMRSFSAPPSASDALYEECMSYIHSVLWQGSRPGLERVTELLRRLGDPQARLKVIHVAGTNGKGSTSAMLASVLREEGYRVGLYTSPYLYRFEERIAVNGEPISREELCRLVSVLRPHAEAMEDKPTEFELITALGFLYFAEKRVDYVVLEVGLGGRLDATNVIASPLLSIVTGIALDHTAILGDTEEAIAREKAGIFKSGTPVLVGDVSPSVAETLREEARRAGAPSVSFLSPAAIAVRTVEKTGITFDYGEHRGLSIPFAALYQPKNASLVVEAVCRLRERGVLISDGALRAGLASVRWRGRFEYLTREPDVIFDGSHNPDGVSALLETVKALYPEGVCLLSGLLRDKDYETMVATLAPCVRRVFCITPENPRALEAPALAEVYRENGIEAEPCPSIEDGVRAAARAAEASGLPLLCAGSLYLYPQVYDAVRRLHAARPSMPS